MKIILDCMSGDNAPYEILKGAMASVPTSPATLVLVGDIPTLRQIASENQWELENGKIELVQADSVVTMEDPALSVVREKNDSSMAVGLHMLASGEGDAFVSAGNTGALHAGSTLIVRRIKGVKKSAIATILPYKNPMLLIDSGANLELTTESYVQFAEMGSIYMEKIVGVPTPRVGLLNIGAERTKGSKLLIETYEALEAQQDLNFIGNMEGRDLPYGGCDVCVCDGFTGNIVLKLTEGCGGYMMSKIKEVYKQNPVAKLSALAVKKGLKSLKDAFDASQYGGAPLLGLSKPVIKAHGSSDALAIFNAIRQAVKCVDTGMVLEIAKKIVPELMEQPSGENAGANDAQPAGEASRE